MHGPVEGGNEKARILSVSGPLNTELGGSALCAALSRMRGILTVTAIELLT
jgi:hypothetical protein